MLVLAAFWRTLTTTTLHNIAPNSKPTTTPNPIAAAEGGADAVARSVDPFTVLLREIMSADSLNWANPNKTMAFWAQQEASYDGVMGAGFGHLSAGDIENSRRLLTKVIASQLKAAATGRPLRALDCGAGVGRVTRELLLHYFHEVDLIEPSRHLIDVARENLTAEAVSTAGQGGGGGGDRSPASGIPAGHRAVNFFNSGLQDFDWSPHVGRYDTIWIQGVAYLVTDADLGTLFRGAALALTPDGVIFVKENICDACSNGFDIDDEEASLTRSDLYFRRMFNKFNMEILDTLELYDVPELYRVMSYALRPKGTKSGQK